MSTLRDALDKASLSLQEQITAGAVRRLKVLSGEVAGELRESYYDFFQNLHEFVLNSPQIQADEPGTPAIFRGSGIPFHPWHEVSARWWMQKEKAAKTGDFRALNFYHGVTESLTTKAFTVKKHRGGIRKYSRSRLSFDQFIQSLAMGGDSVVMGFFGPMKIAYSLQRPDKGKIQITSLEGAITAIRQFAPNGRFTTGIDGTTIRTTITAFPKLRSGMNESSLIEYMIEKSGHPEQWVKIAGGGKADWRIRPILLPLINWYMKSRFITILEERFK